MNSPFSTSKLVPIKLSGDRLARIVSYAFMEALRYFGSFVSRERSPNSKTFDPISARFDLGSLTAPVLRFANRYGAPLGDFVKHTKRRSAKSRAPSTKNRSPVA